METMDVFETLEFTSIWTWLEAQDTFQIGCRLWNLSIISVLILTFSNILLTVRLLHSTDCSQQHQRPPEEPPPRLSSPPPPPPQQSSRPLPATAPLCRPAPNTSSSSSSASQSSNSSIFRVDLRLGRWDSRHLYKLFDFALPGDRYAELSEKYSVCLATQSSIEKLQSLVQVAHHWTGPISAAVFAAADEYPLLQLYVAYLRRCFPVVRDRVSFHLAYPKDRPPTEHLRPSDLPSSGPRLDCRRPEAALTGLVRLRRPDTTKWRLKTPYPQNHLRNLARRNCQTPYVFLTDVDIIPSAKLTEGLDVFLKNARCKGLCAYVIPTYEIDERVHFPRNKTDLIRLAKKGMARPFHHKVFIYNQFATNFSRWQASDGKEEESVHVNHNVTNFEFLYEPFYVAPDTVPAHDERFIGYGYTRNTQVYEMFVAGYQFQVLSPIFTCHWGLQNKKGRPSWRERQNSMNRRHFENFKSEVFARYKKDPLKMISPQKKSGKKR